MDSIYLANEASEYFCAGSDHSRDPCFLHAQSLVETIAVGQDAGQFYRFILAARQVFEFFVVQRGTRSDRRALTFVISLLCLAGQSDFEAAAAPMSPISTENR